MKRLWQGLGLAVLALSLVYLVRFALRHAGELPSLRWDAPALAAFAGAVVLYVLKWGIFERWTGANREGAARRFDELTSEGLGAHGALDFAGAGR